MYSYEQTKTIPMAEYDDGLRSYMMGVYNHMMVALLVTGLTSYLSAPLLAPLIGTAWWFVIALSPLAFVLAFSFGINRMSDIMAKIVFYAYSIAMGASLSIIFISFTTASIAKVFFICSSIFAAASLYGYTTKKDLTSMSTFLLMGMFGLIIASIVNIFLVSSMVAWIISVVAVLVFTAMTAYDTQNLKEEYLSNGEVYGLDSKEKSSIFGALTLYLNFVILFEHLLALLGQKNE